MKARIAIVVAGALACGGAAQGGAVEAHRAFLPQNMQWEAAPSSLPGGAEMAVLVRRSKPRRRLRRQDQGAERLPRPATHASQGRACHDHLRRIQFRSRAGGRPRHGRKAPGGKLHFNARRRAALRFRRRGFSAPDQRNRSLADRLLRSERRPAAKHCACGNCALSGRRFKETARAFTSEVASRSV